MAPGIVRVISEDEPSELVSVMIMTMKRKHIRPVNYIFEYIAAIVVVLSTMVMRSVEVLYIYIEDLVRYSLVRLANFLAH